MFINKNSESFIDKSSEKIIKNLPFSYYTSHLTNDLSEKNINSKVETLSLEEKNSDFSESGKLSLKDKIESHIKTKYSLIVPAILIEIQENGINSIELNKEDLKDLLISLGTIKHIEINGSIAYVLYEHYFSALLAFDVLKELVIREKKHLITIKLFNKEEDEVKQKKVNQQVQRETKKNEIVNEDEYSGNQIYDGLILNYPLQIERNNNFKFNVGNVFSKNVMQSPPTENKKSNSKDFQEKKCSDFQKLNFNFQPSNVYTPNAQNFEPFIIPYHLPFNPIPCQQYFLKFVANYDVQIENDNKFKVTKRLIGNKGLTLKKIIFDSCIKFNDYTTKIRLRGKGSGYKEGCEHTESTDPMQLCVSSLNYFTYSKCCEEVEKFLNQIYFEYFHFLFDNNVLTQVTPKEIIKHEYVVNRFR